MSGDDIPFTRVVRELPASVPFVGPETLERERGEAFRLRLGANESNFGISPKAREAMRAAVERVCWYNDAEAWPLRAAIAERHGVDVDHVRLGSGIDDLLGLVVRMTVAPGTPVVTSDGAYPTFNYHVAGYGGALYRVPYRDDHIDLEALAAKAHEVAAPLVFLANPDNPMGTWHDGAAVSAFIDTLPERCLLVLDEAYVDFAPASVHLPFDPHDPRVVRMRTFSKAHGMAGARIGYAVAHRDIAQAFDKIRLHFGVNRIAQAGALASLQDPDFVPWVVEQVARGREDYYALAGELGLETIPSATNFVALDVGGGERARRLLRALHERGVFVRMPGVAPLDRCIRVTVGTPEERAALAPLLRESLQAL